MAGYDTHSTFDLSALYSTLGVRSKNAIAQIDPGLLLPVIVMGNVETFAPAVIEARGCIGQPELAVGINQYDAFSLFAVAAGGAIIEQIDHGENTATLNYAINVAPNRPFTGAVLSTDRVLSMGGRPIAAIVEYINAGNPPPVGNLLGGSRTVSDAPTLESGIWVPPGWFFWITFSNPSLVTPQSYRLSFRWRELLEAQGSP